MAEQAYQVTLWRSRPRTVLGGFAAPSVVTREQLWLDLYDKGQMTYQVADLIRRTGGDPDNIEQYRLEVADRVTEGVLATVRPSYRDLELIRDGTPVPGSPFTLGDVSDEALIAEMARRMRLRR